MKKQKIRAYLQEELNNETGKLADSNRRLENPEISEFSAKTEKNAVMMHENKIIIIQQILNWVSQY